MQAVAAGAVVEGAMVVPVAVAPVVDHPGDRSRLRVVVAEGRKHEVRCCALGVLSFLCQAPAHAAPLSLRCPSLSLSHDARLHVREWAASAELEIGRQAERVHVGSVF